jgi:SET domain-containing protein
MSLASYRSPKTAVRLSRIVGRGLFANSAIPTGEVVCVKGGHLLTKAEFAQYKSVANDAELQIADELFLAPVSEAEFEDVMMFLNHSCEPNVGIQGQIVFVAMRDIAAGEELTLDYATIDLDTEPMACRCGAAGCRRLITGQDWQKPQLQEKYGSYFAWYLLEKIRAERSARVDGGPDE